MNRLYLFLAIAVLLSLFNFYFISAQTSQTELTIYLEDKGEAEFFGTTSQQNLNLPDEITLNNGKIRGTTQELTSKQGQVWSFSYSLPDSDIQVILPNDAVIKSTSGETFITRGNIAVYSQDSIKVSYVINEDGINYLLITSVLLILLLIIISVYFYRKRKSKKPNQSYSSSKKVKQKTGNAKKLEIIKTTLNDRQNIILDALKKYDKVKSSYLRKICDMPKASFSRHVQELEKKGLIKRSGDGRNKFIELK